MASGGLLQLLAQGPQVNIADRYNQGIKEGYSLADVLGQQNARQHIGPALQRDKGALAQLLLGDPQTGLEVQKMLLKEAGNGDEYGLNPVWAQDRSGNWQLFQPNKGGGNPARVNFPDGVNPQPQVNFLDIGTGYVPRATKGGQPVGEEIPKDIAGAKAEEVKGKGVGEAAVDYASISSKMPGLEKVVADLDKLAETATYTMGGQAVDFGRRQLGMEPRESAIARAEYISKADNQILPLLRDTFGAQFTQKEGESLKATLGDPNLSPQEKQAVLKSFIEQKRRDVEALGSRAGQPGPKRLKFNPETGDLE